MRGGLVLGSQLVEFVNQPTHDLELPPARDVETEKALQSSSFLWAKDMEQEAFLFEHSLEEQQGQGVQSPSFTH